MKHFSITQASAISAFTFVVGQLVAFVPSMGPDKQNLISAGSALIAAVFLIANAIHAHAVTPAVAVHAVAPTPAPATPPVAAVPVGNATV